MEIEHIGHQGVLDLFSAFPEYEPYVWEHRSDDSSPLLYGRKLVVQGEVAAFLWASQRMEGSKSHYIWICGTVPTYRKRGLMDLLMQDYLAWVRRECPQLEYVWIKTTPNTFFYQYLEKIGFVYKNQSFGNFVSLRLTV